MENLILRVLSFDLTVPTHYTFLMEYCISNNLSDKIKFLAMVNFNKYKYSEFLNVIIFSKFNSFSSSFLTFNMFCVVSVFVRVVDARGRSILTIFAQSFGCVRGSTSAAYVT